MLKIRGYLLFIYCEMLIRLFCIKYLISFLNYIVVIVNYKKKLQIIGEDRFISIYYYCQYFQWIKYVIVVLKLKEYL